ncbi:MAG: hypothetical protein QW520_01995 [Methanomassiliicoccales archaeon]
MAVAGEPLTQIVLGAGAAVALLVGIVGRKVKSSEDEFKMFVRILSGLTGVFMIGWVFVMVLEGGWDVLWWIMFLILGVGLLFPLLPIVNIGSILALILAAVTAFAISAYLEALWLLILFLVVFFFLWFVLGILFRAVRRFGAVLGSRVVLLIIGFIAGVMAVYSLVT